MELEELGEWRYHLLKHVKFEVLVRHPGRILNRQLYLLVYKTEGQGR